MKAIKKTVTYRILSAIVTTLIVLAFTGNFQLSGTIGIVDLVVKSFVYYSHEKVWEMKTNK